MNPKIVRSVLAVVLIVGAGLVLSVAVASAAEQAARADGQGSKIAFSRFCLIIDCPLTVEHQQTEIWVMNGDGSNPARLTNNTTWDLGAVWSPNGRTVAFFGVQFVPNPSDPTKDVPVSQHVYLINADGTDQRLLMPQPDQPPSRWPSFSPDGQKIAFDTGNPQTGDIWVVDSDGTDPTNLTNNASLRNIRPDWSPDGTKIAFSRCDLFCPASPQNRATSGEIYVMNADGSDSSDPTCLTCPTDSENGTLNTDNAPAWSPNGQKIAFQKNVVQSNGIGHDEIYVMNADGSDETPLTSYSADNPGDNDDPSWSPNGQQITFERDIPPLASPEVFTMNADGSHLAQLTGPPYANGHPGWGRGAALTP
jgi:Tol biopolymer transport system component